jgi:hypothetical protein
MKRRSFAVVLVTCGLLSPATASAAGAAPGTAPVAPSAPAGPRVAPAPDAPTGDRCAARARQVTRLKRRLRAAETKGGKARTRRLLNASRRSLKRCRAQKPAPTPPAPAPAPAPVPAPPTMPPPSPHPEPGEPAIVVNGIADGVFAPTAALYLQAADLPALAAGSVYHFSVRTPAIPRPPAGGWPDCERRQDSDLTFASDRGEVTLTSARPWCSGLARAFVWAAPVGAEYMGTNMDVATVWFTIGPGVVPTAG